MGTIKCKVTHTIVLKVSSRGTHTTSTLGVITEQLVSHKMQYLAQQAINANLNIYLCVHLCMHICMLPNKEAQVKAQACQYTKWIMKQEQNSTWVQVLFQISDLNSTYPLWKHSGKSNQCKSTPESAMVVHTTVCKFLSSYRGCSSLQVGTEVKAGMLPALNEWWTK